MKKQLLLNPLNRDIYCFAENIQMCRELLKGGARIIQLRAKTIDDTAFFYLAKEMQALMKKYSDSIFIINDRVDIAREINADGIHLGQDDEDYKDVIRSVPEKMIIGVSVDTVDEACEAEQAGATYIGAGAVFPTPTKPDAPVIGLENLSGIVKAVNIPVVAIGGITAVNIQQVIDTGAQYYAVISEINNSKDISGSLKKFLQMIT